MSYVVKGFIQNEYTQRFADTTEFVVIDTTGVGGVDNNVIRGELSEKGIRLTVVKNSLMRTALKEMDRTSAGDLFLGGPCTIAYGGDSVVDVAKELVDWAKKFDAIQMKGAFVDGTVIDGEGVTALSKMPSRVELQGQVVQLAQSPGSNLAGAIAGPASHIAGCIKSLIEKLEEAA
ncbi:MAG: 50S ribosomal protein L10 [Planctomycetota bacterium]|jgi:large subunit ribosomal protein L10